MTQTDCHSLNFVNSVFVLSQTGAPPLTYLGGSCPFRVPPDGVNCGTDSLRRFDKSPVSWHPQLGLYLTTSCWDEVKVRSSLTRFETRLLILIILNLISETVCDEHVVLTGRAMGDLLRAFILECAPKTDRERLLTLITKAGELTVTEFNELRDLAKKHERGFAMHALMTLTQLTWSLCWHPRKLPHARPQIQRPQSLRTVHVGVIRCRDTWLNI